MDPIKGWSRWVIGEVNQTLLERRAELHKWMIILWVQTARCLTRRI